MKSFRTALLLLALLMSGICLAQQPATDSVMDSILGLSKKPATQASSQPVVLTPLKYENDNAETRAGELILSDGKKITGKIATTADKPIRIWVDAEKDYEDIPLEQITSAEAKIIWERDEKEWNFKETGSDIKVYSGKTYPARQTQYKFTLTDGTSIEGDVVAPLYVTTNDGKTKTYVLYKRDKGEIGQKLTDRPYVKSVVFK